jgi:hypothetical protein
MAERQSHAAGQSSYEVRESLRRHPGLDLGLRFTAREFLDACDFALEFLEEHDPKREGRVSALEIVRVSAEQDATVWRYEHDGSRSGHQDPRDVWGFDITAWRGPDPAASRA